MNDRNKKTFTITPVKLTTNNTIIPTISISKNITHHLIPLNYH